MWGGVSAHPHSTATRTCTDLIGFGLPEGLAQVLADSNARAGKGALFDKSGTLSRLIGRPTMSIAKTIAAAL